MRALPALLLFALGGCVRAVHPAGGGEVWQGYFELAAPPQWEVTRNYRWFGNSFFTLLAPNGRDAITVEVFREDRRSRQLPLVLLSDALAMNAGRSMGVQSELLGQNEILVAGRQAWATTLIRRHGPNERLVSAVAMRADGYLILITLHTVPGAYPATAIPWQTVLESFYLPYSLLPPDEPMEDLLMSFPE